MQLRTEIEIDATPKAVWEVLTDRSRYHEWNPFITEFTGELREGATLAVLIAPPDSSEMRFRPRVLRYREDHELRWCGTLGFAWLFQGEHFFEVHESASGGTRFVHGEDFSGFLLKFLAGKLTNTARGFVLMNQALKRRVESLTPPAQRAAGVSGS
jgi:hypothetical protein